MASRTERVLVASAFVIYLALALLLSRTMYSWDDETAHLAFGRVRRAWRIVRFTGRHVRWRRVVPRFVRRVPRLAGGQLARIRALRSGRMVIYGRRTRIGPPLDARP